MPDRRYSVRTSRPTRATPSPYSQFRSTSATQTRDRRCCRIARPTATSRLLQTPPRLPMHSRTSSRKSPSCASQDNPGLPGTRKKPGRKAGLFDFRNALRLVSGGRDELCNQAFVRLEGLLGEIGVEPCDLLRLGYERLVGGLGVFGLHFERLVQRLHARQLLDQRLGVFKRLLGVVAIGACDGLKAVLKRRCGGDDRLEVLFAVLLNVFNFDHDGVLSQTMCE